MYGRSIGPTRIATQIPLRMLGIVSSLASSLAFLAGACGADSRAGAFTTVSDAGSANQSDGSTAEATDGPSCPPSAPPAGAGRAIGRLRSGPVGLVRGAGV